MLKIFIVTFLSMISLIAFSQNSAMDVVTLKRGGVIRGVIVEQIPNKMIKIQTLDQNILVFLMEDVEKIERVASFDYIDRPVVKKVINSGYKFLGELGVQGGMGEFAVNRFAINTLHLYQFNSYISSGGGIGLRFYSPWKETFIPLLADFRLTVPFSRVAPFFALDFGYSFSANHRFQGLGFLYNTSVGLIVKASKRLNLSLSLGYDVQDAEIYYIDDPNFNMFRASLTAFSITLGASI